MTKVLLIEDDEIMRENTAELLELASFEVFKAENGKEGCQKAQEVLPDIIVSDIMMPVLDGYGVLHILSRDPSTAGIPFIFLTAKADKVDVRRGMDLGADDYLSKPFEETELLNAIESRLQKLKNSQKIFSEALNSEQSKAGIAEIIFKELAEDLFEKKYSKKQFIYNEGDDPQYLFYIVEGKVKVQKTHNGGKEYVTSMFGKGDFFGATKLFEDGAYRDAACSLDECTIVKIPKERFYELLAKNRDFSIMILKCLSGNVEHKESELLSLAYDTVRKRTANALLKLSRHEESDSVRVTRDDLASMVGTATETVIRCLSDLKSDGLIEIRGREITLLKKDRLISLPN